MNSILRLVTVVAGLVLLLSNTPSWGQPTCQSPGCNPTVSDVQGNTAGGSGALSNVVFNLGANTAFGAFALGNNTTGAANTAIGDFALRNNTTGFSNTASGVVALEFNTTGNANTASGAGALLSNTTGDDNTASGTTALGSNTTGSRNTAVGTNALSQSTGNKNIAIGFNAGNTLTSGHNNIYLGSPGGASSEFQTMRLGNTQTSTFIAGIATASVHGVPVEVDASGQLRIKVSSARYKRDIEAMGTRSEKMLELRPVTFAYKDDTQRTRQYGLIAEEVAAVYPELVTRTAAGEVQTVRYQELIPMLLNELQRQRQEFQQALQSQQKELADLRALVGQGRETASSAR